MKNYNREVAIDKSMAKTFEYGLDFKIKQSDERLIEGFASTGNVDRDGEIVLPGAIQASFDKFLGNGILLYQHDQKKPIGSVVAGALTENGFYIRARVANNTNDSNEAWALISQGVLKSFSIGFRMLDFEYSKEGIPTVTELELYEVSVVSIPSNRQSLFQVVKSCLAGKPSKELPFAERVKRFFEDYQYFLDLKVSGELNKKFDIQIDGLRKQYDDLCSIELTREYSDALSENEILRAKLLNAELKIKLLQS